jgi:hypothetical protein
MKVRDIDLSDIEEAFSKLSEKIIRINSPMIKKNGNMQLGERMITATKTLGSLLNIWLRKKC